MRNAVTALAGAAVIAAATIATPTRPQPDTAGGDPPSPADLWQEPLSEAHFQGHIPTDTAITRRVLSTTITISPDLLITATTPRSLMSGAGHGATGTAGPADAKPARATGPGCESKRTRWVRAQIALRHLPIIKPSLRSPIRTKFRTNWPGLVEGDSKRGFWVIRGYLTS